MSKGDGKPCLPKPPTPTPKKSPATDIPKPKPPASKKPIFYPSPQGLASTKKKIMEILSKQNFGKYLNIDFLKNLLEKPKGGVPSMGDTGKISGRTMKFPYTFTAKIAQFPYKFYVNNGWLFRYYLIATVVSLPVFYKMGKKSYSPENVREWDEKRRKMFTPHIHH